LVLGACGTSNMSDTTPAEPAQPAALPSSIPASQLVGKWGLASYHQESARERTEKMARAQCTQPYTITAGPNGGVMMHLADSAELYELQMKGGPDGRNYVGPEGPLDPDYDREVVMVSGNVMTMRWLDPDPAK